MAHNTSKGEDPSMTQQPAPPRELSAAGASEIPALLAKAIKEHQTGRLEEAKQLYLQVLAIDVRHAKSLYGLGLIAMQIGNYDAAERMIERAIASNGSDPAFYASLGAALRPQGKTDEALAAYRRALALRPDFEEAHFNAGSILLEQGRLEEGKTHLEGALALRPDCAETHLAMGTLFARESRTEQAAASYRRALEFNPDSLQALNNLGNLCSNSGRLDEAVTYYVRAIALNPDLADAHNNLGAVYRDQGKLEKAAACHERALALKPDYAEAHTNLGIVLRDQGKLEESAACHGRALALRPDFAEAHNNLGNTLRSRGLVDEARRSYEQALELDAGSIEARWNRGLVALLQGDFAAGWRDYEIRFQRKRNTPRSFSQPLWRGEPLKGATILLHAEQGLGDTIQFLRYVPLVLAAGGKVILDVPASMLRIAARIPGLAAVIATGDPLPAFAWHCPLMSLPLAFGTTLESIPSAVPYLTVPEDARRHADALCWPRDGLRMGLVWSGNTRYLEDRIRSIPFAWFVPLLDVDSARFFSLQMGPAAAQLPSAETRVTDLQSAIKDVADTAALMSQLDLVLTVDTSVAHLGGALAKPTWVLLPFAPDWRWLTEREDSPWYPTVRLFRQPQPGDWASVIDRVCAELAKLASQRRAIG
jgi:tetratricopeptide (TPR) repeat protein